MTQPLPPLSRLLWATVGLTVILHAVMAANFGLSTDEAHYALYAYFPALSYFDHPPLVGWSQRPFFWLFEAPSDWMLRLVPMACHALTLLILTRFTAQTLGFAAARWTAIILAVAPLPHVLGAAQVPDTLLMLWASCLMVHTYALSQTRTAPTLRQWVWLGALLGLAGLSKYTAAFFVPPVIYILIRAHGFTLLRQAGPWLAMGIAFLLISPVLLWNAQHAWISFVYQGAHGTGNKAWQIGKVFQQWLLQSLVYGPLLTLLPLAFLKKEYRSSPDNHQAIVLCFLFALPFLGILFFLAGRSNALPHWTAPAWLLLAPVAGWLASQHAQGWKRWLAGIQGVLCLGLVGWMLSGGSPDPHGLKNPPADLYGWAEAGSLAQELATNHHLEHLAVQNWSIASRIAWYARPLPTHVLDTRFDQFDLWAGDLPVGKDALLIEWSSLPYVLPVGEGQFTRCTPLTESKATRWGKTLSFFQFYQCENWGGKPAPREKND